MSNPETHIPRHWRLREPRYRLKGSVCPRCGKEMFPPRKGGACLECGSVGGREGDVMRVVNKYVDS